MKALVACSFLLLLAISLFMEPHTGGWFYIDRLMAFVSGFGVAFALAVGRS